MINPSNKHNRLLRYFISGLVTILPFVVTIGIVIWLVNFFLSYLGPNTMFGKLLNNIGIQFKYQGIMAYIIGWGLILLLIFIIGVFVNNIISKYFVNLFDYIIKTLLSFLGIKISPDTSISSSLVHYFDNLIKKIPLVGMIYKTTKQITDLVNKDNKSDLNNMSPVYCRFGSMPGTLCLALLPSSEDYIIEGNHYKLVMIPTAPVPFGGGLFFIPVADVFAAPMSIETLLSFYVSMGVTRSTSETDLVIPTVPLNTDSISIIPASKTENTEGPLKIENTEGPSKTENTEVPLKTENTEGPSKTENTEGPSKNKNYRSSFKNRKHRR